MVIVAPSGSKSTLSQCALPAHDKRGKLLDGPVRFQPAFHEVFAGREFALPRAGAHSFAVHIYLRAGSGGRYSEGALGGAEGGKCYRGGLPSGHDGSLLRGCEARAASLHEVFAGCELALPRARTYPFAVHIDFRAGRGGRYGESALGGAQPHGEFGLIGAYCHTAVLGKIAGSLDAVVVSA